MEATIALPTFFASLVLSGLLIWISIIDLHQFRIPNWLNISLIISGLVHAATVSEDITSCLIGATVGYLSLALWGELYFRIRRREGLGLGDAKLFSGAGAWLGWQDLPLVLLIAALGGLAYAFISRTGPKDRIAFGPFIALAIFSLWIVR